MFWSRCAAQNSGRRVNGGETGQRQGEWLRRRGEMPLLFT
jgi:hypothetical protein